MAVHLHADKVQKIYEMLSGLRPDGKPYTNADIASAIGCAEITVSHYREGRRKRHQTAVEKREKIRELYNDGVKICDIVKWCHTSHEAVKNATFDLPPRRRHTRLSRETVMGIRAAYVRGDKISVIEAAYKVHEGTVRRVTQGLPRRQKDRETVNMQKCVLIDLHGENSPYMVQPTGRMEFCTSSLALERQWHVEVVDARDGRIKLIPWIEIAAVVLPVADAPSVTAQKRLQQSA